MESGDLHLIPEQSVAGEDAEDTRLLHEMVHRAEHYIRHQPWCLQIFEGRFVAGIGGIIALTLFKVSIKKVSEPEQVWVFTGDVPSVYLDFSGFESPYAALERYVEGLEEWGEAVDLGSTVDDLIPIEVEPTSESAESLRSRCKSIRELVLPWFSKDAVSAVNGAKR